MTATVNVLCYKSKTLSNGEHPLMIRVCKDGKKKYASLGVSVKAEHWNFEKNLPKTNCPNKEYINILIQNLVVFRAEEAKKIHHSKRKCQSLTELNFLKINGAEYKTESRSGSKI